MRMINEDDGLDVLRVSHHGQPIPEEAQQRRTWPHIPSLPNHLSPMSNTLVTARVLQVGERLMIMIMIMIMIVIKKKE